MTPSRLIDAAERFGTPLYVYDIESILERLSLLKQLFNARLGISYAIKANPNASLLTAMQPDLDCFDASSIAEVLRAQQAGMKPAQVSFSGPAKRECEIRAAVDLRIGELIIENFTEAKIASAYAIKQGIRQPCLVRINPLNVPRKFGASMARNASQFGIDEEEIDTVLPKIAAMPGLRLIGFHIYSGTNCLDSEAIIENFRNFERLFRQAQLICGIKVEKLVFGSGFGIPYLPEENLLDHEALSMPIISMIDDLLSSPGFEKASCNLELGRWLVGPYGWLISRVIAAKQSRGVAIRACDAGFNNHLAACGLMGSVFRRNWRYQNLSNPDGPIQLYTLVGPLCTTIDRLAADLELPELHIGNLIAVEGSGAYGLTASPNRFISHPEPREVIIDGDQLRDVSEVARYPLVENLH